MSGIIKEERIGGQFQSGNKPWNKGVKGLRHSPSTEFKKGRASERKLPVGTVTVRHRKKDKHPRAWVKVAEPSVWRERSKVVWEASNGPVPRGSVVHHKDRNPLSDEISNLQAMTRAEHAREHYEELVEARDAKN